MAKKGYLILENRDVFEGESFGDEKEIKGEVVFNTGMVGYPESFTDPSYFGQILVMTYPLIGNYGVPSNSKNRKIDGLFESGKIQIRSLVVENNIDDTNHWQSRKTLSMWLKEEGVPALSGIDTRTLTKILREKGVMRGIVTFKKPRNLSGFTFYDINKDNIIPFVSCKKIARYGNGNIKILFIDCGLKYNQIRILTKYDTTVIQVPWDYNPFQSGNNIKFDAVFISNGPGDARKMGETIETVREVLKRKIPTFGICLGHQVLTLAAGGEIYKLKYGHRSQNQPVKNELTDKCYITSQNHGYASIPSTLSKDWKIWFTNLNDGTNEGIHHKTLPFFSVQFHPEASPGPTDTEWLFDYFIKHTEKWMRTR